MLKCTEPRKGHGKAKILQFLVCTRNLLLHTRNLPETIKDLLYAHISGSVETPTLGSKKKKKM